MKKVLFLSLAAVLAGLFLSAETVFGSEVYETTLSVSFCFRHNGGGYWMLCGNGGSAAFSDESISGGSLSCSGSAYLMYTLPAEVVSALKEHPDLRVRLEDPGTVSSVDFAFFAWAFTGPGSLAMELRLLPRIAEKTLNDFLPGLSCPVPLVDYNCGKNIYLVYSLAGGPCRAPGFYSDENPQRLSPPLVHPSLIKDSGGNFASGTTINVDGLNRNAAFYTVGKKNSVPVEDAVLLEFYCPIKLVFYIPKEGEEEHQVPGALPWLWPLSPLSPEPEKEFGLRLHRLR